MNSYALLGACALVVGAFFYGQHVGKTSEALDNAEKQALIAAAAAQSREAAAEEIAKIKIVNRTVNQKVIHETTKEIYNDPACRIPASGVHTANQAITGQLTGAGELPQASGDQAGQ